MTERQCQHSGDAQHEGGFKDDSELPLLYHIDSNSCSNNIDTIITNKEEVVTTLSSLKEQISRSANQGRFDEAQVYVNAWIHRNPGHPYGYLASGYLYSQQGKQQAAINIYNKYLQTTALVVPVMNNNNNKGEEKEHILLLHNHYQIAQDKLHKRIDFVTMLPLDITTLIFDYVGDDHKELAVVSKLWSHYVLEIPSLWHVLQCDWYRNFVNETYLYLPTVQRYVQDVALVGLEENNLYRLVSMAQYGKFASVKRIRCATIYNLKLLLSFIYPLMHNLTCLDINDVIDYSASANFPLGLILSSCPKLQYLHIKVNNSPVIYPIPTVHDNNDSNEQQQPLYKQLKSFAVNGCYKLCDQGIANIVSRSPNLRAFGSSNKVEAFTLAALDQHCPNLKTVLIQPNPQDIITISSIEGEGQQQYIGYPRLLHENKVDKQKKQNGGLEVVSVNDGTMFNPVALRPLLKKSQDTLKTLNLTLHHAFFSQVIWPTMTIPSEEEDGQQQQAVASFFIGLCPFTQLRQFRYTSMSGFGRIDKIAIPILKMSSLLERVEFKTAEGISDEVVKALMTVSRLKYLTVSAVNYVSSTLLDLFKFHAYDGCHGNCSSVVIDSNENKKKRKQQGGQQPENTNNASALAKEKRQTSPSLLEQVSISHTNSVTNEILNVLADIPKLKMIRITGENNLTRECLKTSIRRFYQERNIKPANMIFSSMDGISDQEIQDFIAEAVDSQYNGTNT
ncbi:hypothetical protein BDA99DRAFT_555473 [Phascolomyces articulosus]|uniref:F-box domain-containing protein n=1 Tax=Phascolomyces articulosus TaxID=60185 RepID=A0AAD5KMV3_9FUNG|nr:hypothetical protein BDA99DRAFT_555473 [Phascolomyces articulosus]